MAGLGRQDRRPAAVCGVHRGRRGGMILTELGPVTAYRMHTPRWATAPTSGAGAAAHGGRANRPGVTALYLALEPETAVREYQQLSPLMPPGTLVSYTVRLEPVVDFRAGYDAARWHDLWESSSAIGANCGSTSAWSHRAGCLLTKRSQRVPRASCSHRRWPQAAPTSSSSTGS